MHHPNTNSNTRANMTIYVIKLHKLQGLKTPQTYKNTQTHTQEEYLNDGLAAVGPV